MIKFFVERPVAASMLFLSLLVLGVYAFLNTPLELAPKEEYPQAYVISAWPGVPPEIVQVKVTAPLEEALTAVKGVRKMTSRSSIGRSEITLEFDLRTDMRFANLAVREEIARARPGLPYGVRPEVEPYVPEDFRTTPFLDYTISGPYPLQKLRELVAEKVTFAVGGVPGVSGVGVGGGSDPEVLVTLDKDRMKALDLTPLEALAAIQERLRIRPAGTLARGTQEYLVKVADPVTDLRALGETVVARSGPNAVRVADIARVSPSYGEIYYLYRIDGQPTISLTVSKEKGANSLTVAREVKARLAAVRRTLPADLKFRTVNDESEDIGKNLADLGRLAAIIVVSVFAMIWVGLRRFGPSILILSSIAFSTVLTFILIFVFKVSMNMLTLGALALGFGMFVDDSIVVFENTLRLREAGVGPREASLRGPREVFVAVLASTLTTISVFACFPYFQGRLKMFYLPLAVVISSALAASLLVSFTFIPALSPRVLGEGRVRPERPGRGERFERLLGGVVRHPVLVLAVVGGLLYGSYRWFRAEVTIGQFFPWSYEQSLGVRIGLPAGTRLERADAVIRAFEAKALEQPYEKEMTTRVSAENAYLEVRFPPKIEASYRPYALKEELIRTASQFAGIDVGIYGFDPQSYYSSMGTGPMYGSRIKFFGYNLKKLREITSALERLLKRNPRIKDVRTVSDRYYWGRDESFEDVLRVDGAALGGYDIDPAVLYGELMSMLRGRFGAQTRVILEGRDLVVSMKYPDADQADVRGIQQAMVRSRNGRLVRLGEVSTLEERPIAGAIEREDQQFQQTVMWDFRGPSKAEEKYRKAVFAGLSLPPGFSATLEESWLMTEKEKGQITLALVVSLLLIYMILAALYESLVHPFFILLAVPLAMIGVFAAFVVAKYPFDSSAYIGVVLLGGIVVKNAILLVDHVNLLKRRGLPTALAAVRGARERVRPIFMTTSTTVFGMLPMLLIQAETGLKRRIWSSLALSTLGGLVSSTLLVLVVIPVFYIYGDRLTTWVSRKARELRG